MTVSFVDIFETVTELSLEEINYIIPYSGKLVIKDVEQNSCVLNHKLIHNESLFELPVRQDDIILTSASNTIRIKILKGEISQESIIEYQDICKHYLSYVKDGYFDYHDMLKIFDINSNDAIKLCSFNKKFSELIQSSNRDDILKYVKDLPHIFYRPKLHLKQVEEVRPASIVTRIGTESIRHLASHSEHWKGIKANGLVPERLLARILEDDYAIYENVAAKTIVDRLYAFEKKEYDDIIDIIMNSQLEDSYSQGGERKNFFKALSFLLQGFAEKKSDTMQQYNEKARKVIEEIIEYLSKCKSTELYRKLKREKEIKGKLKKTNIFMMDNYYKNVYQLWEIFGKEEEITEILDKKEIKEEYLVYVELIILFCLDYMGFKPELEDETLLTNNLFNQCSFSFEDWKIILNTEKAKLFDGFITAEITQKKKIPVNFTIDLPECNDYQHYNATKNNNQIIFEEKLNENEQTELCNILQKYIDKKQQGKWKNDFKKTLHDAMMKVSYNKEQILFVPWKYGIADDYKIAKETLKQICDLIPNGFDECYILNISRPNELRSITDEELLSSLISYSLKNQESSKTNELGIIPVTLNDINSFRRFSKIFLKNMITLKNEQNCCPQCGSQLKGDKIQGYYCVKKDCNFKIYNSQCPDCKKKFWYTDYTFPNVFQLDTDSVGMKILLNENNLGFKNITPLIGEDKTHKPECPYCTKGNTLHYEGKYSIDKFLITTEKKKRALSETKNPITIKNDEVQKKPLVTGTVNFVKPTMGNIQNTIHRKEVKMNNVVPKQTSPIKEIKEIRNVNLVKCPCCNIVLNKGNYSNHLQIHSDNQTYKILSKNLATVDMVLCPICLEAFAKNESFSFLNHIEEMHPKIFNLRLTKMNTIIRCKNCNSLLLGVHPAIIIQHLLNGCKK